MSSLDEKVDGVQTFAEPIVGESYVIDPVAEKKLVRKLDWYIVPLATLVYFISFLDRSNIANARADGFTANLNLGTYGFNIGACVYYIVYMFCEIPAGIIIKKVGFICVPISIFAFSITTLCTTWVKSAGGFYAVRCVLGLCEAFTMPGITYMLARYYRPHELTYRCSLFMLIAAGSSQAFGGLLAGALVSVGSVGSVTGWRLIFLIEGIITIGISVILVFLFPADPQKTRYLNEEERKLAIARLLVDQPDTNQVKEATSLRGVKQAICNVPMAALIFFYIANSMTVQGFGIFTTTILKLNYPKATTRHIQFLSVGPQAVGAFIGVCGGYVAVKTKRHVYPLMFGQMLCLVGYAILIGTSYNDPSTSQARYAGVYLGTAGGYMYGPITLGWALSNASPDTARAVTGGAITGIGTIGSIVATWSYIATDAHTGYRIGNALNLSLGGVVFIGSFVLMLYLKRENAFRDRGGRDYILEQPGVKLETLGRLHPSFRYTI